ncbi:glycosyltransferase family 4 protein [Bryobacter aggregatus]|uniref:glycosyltransferase family 4 protein n=1 Tax=Bryobacter aggregatus TaxID=360054 RepID=UPI0004E23DD9|nr:glycosyltransferase family 4 protein [Bryobacter aggregatus]
MLAAKKYSCLLICFSYPPVLGGSEIEAQRVCRALRERGHRVLVLCAGHPEMPAATDWVDPYGTPVRSIGHGAQSPQLDRLFAVGVARELWRLRKEVDVVYFLMQGLHLVPGLPICRWLGLPIVMKISGSGIVEFMQKSFLGRLELGWLQRWAKRVMVLNDGIAQEAVNAGFDRQQLFWMPNPVDVDEFAPVSLAERKRLRAAAGIAEDAPVAVYVGRLAPEKELGSLLEAFALVQAQAPAARLILVGDGPERATLEAASERLQLASFVQFVGRQPMNRVLEYLQLADVFTLVSRLEGFPCSLIEAMSTGLASLVSRIPANEQLVEDGVHGWSGGVRNAPELAAALLRLIENPEQRAAMGVAGRQRIVDNYSSEKIAERYEELFAIATTERT